MIRQDIEKRHNLVEIHTDALPRLSLRHARITGVIRHMLADCVRHRWEREHLLDHELFTRELEPVDAHSTVQHGAASQAAGVPAHGKRNQSRARKRRQHQPQIPVDCDQKCVTE